MQSEKRNVWVFVGLIVLNGFVSVLTRLDNLFVGSVMFCLHFMIYAGLLLFWMQSVRARLLPTRARTDLLAIAILMLAYLIIRLFKYRITGWAILLSRYAVYAYWIPQMLIPGLFLVACVRIRRGQEKGKRDERLLLIPACALAAMAMTNDLHRLVYVPKIELSDFYIQTGTYTYGPGLYLMYAWMAAAMFTGIALLLRETGRRPKRGTLWLLGVITLWFVLILLCLLVFDRKKLPRMYQIPEIHIFCMLAVFEICIRLRLIPHNENYAGFFSQLDLPVLITDRDFRPVYQTSVPIMATPEQFSDALAAPVDLNDDARLSGMELRAGCTFWTEDERELHRLNRRLASANEILSEENDLIAVENKLREKQAQLDAQVRVYDRIAAALYPRQQRIGRLLDGVRPDTPEFRRALGECCVLNAWSKRKSNLLLLSEKTLSKRNRELFLALQETARFLKCCGVEAAAVGEEYSELPIAAVHALYDTFETVIEAYLPVLKRMNVTLFADGLRLVLEAAQTVALPETALPAEQKQSDEFIFLTIHSKRGGEVR